MENNSETKKDEKTGYSGRDESLIKQIRCSHSWPSCIFDFTVTKTLHEFFVFKVRASADSTTYNDKSIKDHNNNNNNQNTTGEPGEDQNDIDLENQLAQDDIVMSPDLRSLVVEHDYVEKEH